MNTDRYFIQLAEFNEWLEELEYANDIVVSSEAVRDLMFRAWCAGQEMAVQKLSKPHRGK